MENQNESLKVYWTSVLRNLKEGDERRLWDIHQKLCSITEDLSKIYLTTLKYKIKNEQRERWENLKNCLGPRDTLIPVNKIMMLEFNQKLHLMPIITARFADSEDYDDDDRVSNFSSGWYFTKKFIVPCVELDDGRIFNLLLNSVSNSKEELMKNDFEPYFSLKNMKEYLQNEAPYINTQYCYVDIQDYNWKDFLTLSIDFANNHKINYYIDAAFKYGSEETCSINDIESLASCAEQLTNNSLVLEYCEKHKDELEMI